MNAFGSIVVGIFGVFWTIGAASMGAPIFMVLFGIVFVGIAVVQGIFHFKNATGTNRMSLYEITNNEPDPMDKYVRQESKRERDDSDSENASGMNFCPYCGNRISNDAFRYCPSCGKELRRE
jgi:ribosomal protein L32